MPVDRCARCNISLGSLTQETIPGVGVEKLCPSCERNKRAEHILRIVPVPGEREWDRLREKDQEFLLSVRRQWGRKGTVSEAQLEWLESIYERSNE